MRSAAEFALLATEAGFRGAKVWLDRRAHLAHKDLEEHIADVIGVLEVEDLRNVILVGHSYGGMVATGVADRASDRLARLVYLDAFAPGDGQSLLDLQTEETRRRVYDNAKKEGEGGASRPILRRPIRSPRTSPG